MTNLEFYTKVANGELTAEVKAMAQAVVDKEHEKAAARQAKNEEILAAVYNALKSAGDAGMPAAAIVDAIGMEDVTPSKVSYLLREGVANGKVVKGNCVLEGSKRAVVSYKLA